MALFDKFNINGQFQAYCEGPIASLNTVIPASNRWAKRYIYNPSTGQDDIFDRVISEYVDHYYISTDGTKALIHLMARDTDPAITANPTEENMGKWNVQLAAFGFTLANWKTVAEVQALIADGTYVDEVRFTKYEG